MLTEQKKRTLYTDYAVITTATLLILGCFLILSFQINAIVAYASFASVLTALIGGGILQLVFVGLGITFVNRVQRLVKVA